MDLEISESARVRREEAAERLRELADQLSRHNQVSFKREGMKFTVPVPDEVEYSFEIEIDSDGAEIEVEITW